MRSYANYVSLYYLRNEYPQMFGNNPDGYFFLGRQSLTIFAKKIWKQKKKKLIEGRLYLFKTPSP
jgi:hypothetical protein